MRPLPKPVPFGVLGVPGAPGVFRGSHLAACVLLLAVACGGRARVAPRPTSALDDALAEAQARVAQAPDDAAAQRELGWLQWMSGDRVRAEQAFGIALERSDGHDARALLGKAMVADAVGREEEALAVYLLLVEESWAGGDEWARAAAPYALSRLASWAGDGIAEAAGRRLDELTRSGPPELVAAGLRALGAFTDPRADAAPAAALAERRGCVPVWALGFQPGGAPHVALLSAAPQAPDVPASVQLAPARRCEAWVRPPRRRPARAVLGTFLENDRERELEIEVRFGDPDALGRVWIAGGLVLGRDSARRFLPERLVTRARVKRGVSSFVVEVAALGNDFPVEVVVRDPATGRAADGVTFAADPTTRPAGFHARAAEFVAAPPPFVPPAAPRLADTLIVDFLLARDALARRDVDAAAEAAERVHAAAPRFTPALLLQAEVGLTAPAQSRELARDEARRRLRRALEVDPGAAPARAALAALLLEDDDPTAALAALGDQLDGIPPIRYWRADLVRMAALDRRGLRAEAEAALEAALAARPDACELMAARLRFTDEHGDLAERRAAAVALVLCDGESAALAYVAGTAGEHANVILERERLLERAPDDPARHLELGRALRAAGRRADARAAFERAVALSPYAPSPRLALADVLAAGGDVPAARAVLEEGLGLSTVARDLAAALVALGGVDPIDPWRIDGLAVIREFEADERAGRRPPYDAPAVLVLDRTVVLVMPDGGRLLLTHNIVKVLQKEGLERWGELDLPGNAEVLTARTVKADGTTREPESLGDKQGLTAPDLAVGDYVEVEHLSADEPSLAFPGGFGGERFFFATYDAPLDRTELVVAARAARWPIEWDVRADAPRPTVEERPGGWRVTTFADRRRAQLSPEPSGPPTAELVASARPFAGVSLAAWRDFVAEQAYGARRGDRAVRQVARQVTAGLASPEAKAKALYDFVLSRIEDGGSLADEPALILARRAGRRVVLYLALCEAAGIPTDLLLARPRTAGEGPPPSGSPDELGYALARVRLPGGDRVVDLRYRYAPFGYLMPTVRGAPALEIPDPELTDAGAPRLETIPAAPSEADLRAVEIDVALRADGSASIEVKETMTGVAAAGWRDYLAELPPDELERDLEQRALGYYFPGVALRSVAIDGREDADRPLVITVRADAPRFARAGPDGELEIPLQPMPAQIGRRYVLLGARTTPLVYDVASVVRTSMRVRLPAGWRLVEELPPAAALAAPAGAGTFRHEAHAEPGGFASVATVDLPSLARVPAPDYPAFVRFAGAVDARESATVRAKK